MKKAFTLIELLIVIAIIGILASVIVISLSDQSGKASKSKAEFNVAQAIRYAEIQIVEGDTAEDDICPNGSVQALDDEKDTLYCGGTSTGYVVYEIFANPTTGTGNIICADNATAGTKLAITELTGVTLTNIADADDTCADLNS